VPGARVDDDEGPLERIDRDTCRRAHAGEKIVHRPRQGSTIADKIRFKAEHMRHFRRVVLFGLFGARAQHVEEHRRALNGINKIITRGHRAELVGHWFSFRIGATQSSRTKADA
jgi:hypothetical protein